LQATGYVTARRQATVSAQITGALKEVLIEEGERVTAGQVLAKVDDTAQRAGTHYDQMPFGIESGHAQFRRRDDFDRRRQRGELLGRIRALHRIKRARRHHVTRR
jgi:multidrug resistance efflux pump